MIAEPRRRPWRAAACLAAVVVAGLLGAPAAVAQEGPRITAAPREPVTVAPLAQSPAQTLAEPDLGGGFAPLVERVAPAVVNIFIRKVVRQERSSPLLEEPIMRWLFGGQPPRVAGESVETTLGSGVVVSPNGLVVTNHHVIGGASDILIVLNDRREYLARLVLDDAQTDLAVLKIETDRTDMAHLELAPPQQLRVGDLVVALGNPYGVGQTVTTGIVSALARTAVGISDFNFFIQTDAAVNPGNSGGALVDMNGRLVGVNTAIYSRTGGSVGIGFAVPSSMVRAVLRAAAAGGPLVRPWIGATGRGLPAEIALRLGFERPFGAFMLNVHPEGPFAAAGGQVGDIVLAVDDVEVQDAEALRFRIATEPVGASLRFTLRRGWTIGDVAVELIAPPETPPPDERRLRGYHPLAGARVASLSPALAERIGVDSAVSGIVVLGVSRASAADRQGLRRGDVLRAIDGEELTQVGDLARFLRRPYPGWQVTVRRDGEEATLRMSMVSF